MRSPGAGGGLCMSGLKAQPERRRGAREEEGAQTQFYWKERRRKKIYERKRKRKGQHDKRQTPKREKLVSLEPSHREP